MIDTFRLDRGVVHLDHDTMRPLALEPDLWAPPHRAELGTGHILSIFTYDADWTEAEHHPTGDELVVVLDGRIELRLDAGTGEEAQPLDAGEAAVVPAGTWHHVLVVEPCTLLFVTPTPRTTVHRPA